MGKWCLTCFLSLSVGSDVHSHFTCWLLCNWTVTTLHCPHWTPPKSRESVEMCMPGMVTLARKRRCASGPLIIWKSRQMIGWKRCSIHLFLNIDFIWHHLTLFSIINFFWHYLATLCLFSQSSSNPECQVSSHKVFVHIPAIDLPKKITLRPKF